MLLLLLHLLLLLLLLLTGALDDDRHGLLQRQNYTQLLVRPWQAPSCLLCCKGPPLPR
jgi:hypothetical protein